MCFKHFKEGKYYYGRTSANENVKQKWLDVFLWLTVKRYSEVSRSSHREVLYKNTFSTEQLQMSAFKFLQKDIDKCK